MKKGSSIETTDISNLSDQTKFRLNENNKIKDYFNTEIQEIKIMSKKLSKSIAAFDYFDKTLIVLSWRSYWSYWSSCRNSKCKFQFNVFFDKRNNKKLLKLTKNKKKKHNKVVVLAKSKLNSIETLIS